MRKSFLTCYAIAAMISAASLMTAQAPAPAEGKAAAKGKGGRGGPATPAGPTPHLTDGTVDLSGAWMGSGSNSGDISKGLKPGERIVVEGLQKIRSGMTVAPRQAGGQAGNR